MSVEAPYAALQQITGSRIEDLLIDLAAIGGKRIDPTPEQAVRYATNRPALSKEDKEAFELNIKPAMEQAKMEIYEHPFGLVGIRAGRDPTLPPVVPISHIDTVPKGDMYDGTLGSKGAIEVVRVIGQQENTVMVAVVTGEESASYKNATFASKSMLLGLSEADLDSRNDEGERIRDKLTAEEIEIVKRPIFGPGCQFPTPKAVIELHVEQGNHLATHEAEIGVVEAIAAAVRYRVRIGDRPLTPDTANHAYTRYLSLDVEGRADHSGTTPMGIDTRADGLLETARFLGSVSGRTGLQGLAIGATEINEQAINKIPGITRTSLRLTGNDKATLDNIQENLTGRAANRNEQHALLGTLFGEKALSIQELAEAPAADFFPPQAMFPRQRAAFLLTRLVNQHAEQYSGESVVGGVTTYDTTATGFIELGVDFRGRDKHFRDIGIRQMTGQAAALGLIAKTDFGEPLAGSGDPVTLDKELGDIATRTIAACGISSMRMFSAAGHDVQNAALAGIPAILLFCPSRNGGKAHHPDAYSTPEDLEKGVRALAALTIELAS